MKSKYDDTEENSFGHSADVLLFLVVVIFASFCYSSPRMKACMSVNVRGHQVFIGVLCVGVTSLIDSLFGREILVFR